MSNKYYPLAIVLLGSLLVGCTDVLDRDFYDDGYTPSVVLEAKQFIESGKVRVSLLDMGRAYMSVTEKNTKANAKADFSIDWGNYRVRTEGSEDVVYVPIKVNRKNQQAFSLLSEDGRMIGNNHQIYYALMLFPGRNGQGFDAVMATYLYGRGMAEDDVMLMGRDLESADYTGYYITSCLDGTMLAGRYVENGETKFGFRQNPVSPKDRKVKTDATEQDTIRKHTHSHHLFLNINPLKHIKQTKSGNHDMEWLMTHCSFCEKLWDECDCVTIYPKCEYCDTDVISNRCSNACDRCDVCLIGSPGHNHNTYNPPVNPPGGGGSTGGGGGGPSPDPDPQPEPEPEPEDTSFVNRSPQERAAMIKQKAEDVVKGIKKEDPNGQEPKRCNVGVARMMESLYGEIPSYMQDPSNETYPYVLANTMVNMWLQHGEDWEQITRNSNSDVDFQNMLYEVQRLANEGYFVVSGWQNSSGSGHVTVIVPGEGKYRYGTGWSPPDYWGFYVPYSMDTGEDKRWSSKTLSSSYGGKKKYNVLFFYYKK